MESLREQGEGEGWLGFLVGRWLWLKGKGCGMALPDDDAIAPALSKHRFASSFALLHEDFDNSD